MDAGGDKPKRVHKKSGAGAKAKKKRDKDGKKERHNPKAFTFSGGARSVHKRVIHSLEKQSKKEHAPKIDRTPDVPPPFVVVVHGPPGVGKTTLIHSLVKQFAKQKLINMRGPVTLVSSKQRRITIVECTQDMSTMLDLAKIADLVVFMIDGSFGFELETFEFINVLQVHGFPRVIGVLTHLDAFKDNKLLRKTKKTLKHRFWTEVFDGAKLFYLSGLQYGRYHRLEVANLARFIAVQRAQVLSWRQSHPYVLGLRWEDHTEPSLPEEHPRRLDIYGYVYGGRLRDGAHMHLAGVGDFHVAGIKQLPDPCPPPMDSESAHAKAKEDAGQGGKKKVVNALRTLAERHRIIYAPGSDIGSVTVDSEAMYINLPDNQTTFTKLDEEKDEDKLPDAIKMVRTLQNKEGSLDLAAASRPGLRLLKGSARFPVESFDGEHRQRRPAPEANGSLEPDEASEGETDDDQDDQDAASQDNSDDEDEDEHRRSIIDRAKDRFALRARLEEAIYGPWGKDGDDDQADGEPSGLDKANDSGIMATDHKTVPLFEDDEIELEAPRLGLGKRLRQADRSLLGNRGDVGGLETSRMSLLPREREKWNDERKEALKLRKFVTGGWSSGEEDENGEPKNGKVESNGDAEEDGDEAENPTEQAGGSSGSNAPAEKADPLEKFNDGMPIATFVRVRLEDVPAACVAELRRDRVLLLGGLLPGEAQKGLVQVRVKRHRWHPKLLKSGDAMLVSAGWRRYQTVPTFSLEDRGEKRMRYLKYTLEHAHCHMTVYGPMVPPGSGIMVFRSWSKVGHFRVAATGGVLESANDFNIVKKLKLVGEPYKVFKNTAFIKNMFNSDLEVAKYAHAKIQTVSGIRGEIKKAEGTKGCFRATFEDRILMSDIVICKCWVKVSPKEFYHPVMDIGEWRPARQIGELRAANSVPVPFNKDSQYGAQNVRPERKFNPLRLPRNLEAALPYKSKPKEQAPKSKNALRKKAAVVSTHKERNINDLLHKLYTVRNDKHRLRTETRIKKNAVKGKREKYVQDKRDGHKKEANKKRYIKEGQKEEKNRKAMRLD